MIRVFAALGLALGIAVGSPAMAVKDGGTVTVGVETDVRGFDPGQGLLGISGRFVSQLIHERLISYDPEADEFGPVLATEWSSNDDKTEWTFKLREGVTYHNGAPFNAEQVAFHYNRILDPEQKARARSRISVIEEVVAVDDHTVKFILKHPWQPFLAALATTEQPGMIAEMGQVKADKQLREPVGTGPYRFVEWRGGDRIVLERNPDYWNPDKTHVDRFVFRILPDTQTRYAALQTGEIDLAWTDRGNTIQQASKDPEIVHHIGDGGGAAVTFFNLDAPPLDDQRVRAALSHAWSQEAILNVTWKNTRPFARDPFGDQLDCGDANYREYDPAKAKALLEDYGKPVSVSMIHTTTPRGRELGEVMQQLYRKVGVELKLEPVDQNTLVKRVYANDYQISGWRIGDAPDIGPQLYALHHSDSSYNLTNYRTEAMDKLVEDQRVELAPEKRAEMLCRIAEIMNESGHIQYRGGNRYHVFTRPWIKDVEPIYEGAIDLSTVWIDK